MEVKTEFGIWYSKVRFHRIMNIAVILAFGFLHSLNRAIQPGESPYSVVNDSIVLSDSSIDCNVLNKRRNVLLSLKLQTLKKYSVRFTIKEANPLKPRYEVKDVLVQEPETVG